MKKRSRKMPGIPLRITRAQADMVGTYASMVRLSRASPGPGYGQLLTLATAQSVSGSCSWIVISGMYMAISHIQRSVRVGNVSSWPGAPAIRPKMAGLLGGRAVHALR